MMTDSEQCLHGAVAKRRKVAEVSLCDLPMDILSAILSLLPINDAIRTSVLSKKFKFVWCSHTNLTFNKCTLRKTYFRPSKGYFQALYDKEFITRVDTILHQHSGTGVERMEIKFLLESKHADHIDSWISFAIASKTKEFVVNVSGEPYSLPSQFFSPNNGSHLQCLELWSVSLQLPSDYKGFLNLKSLTLVDVSITNEDVQCMLSKCNLLEFFEIAYCRNVTSIRMLHPLDRLMHLVVDVCAKLKEIELNCGLATLKYTGIVVPLVFASTSKLTNINVAIRQEKMLNQSALSYMITGFPATLPRLEALTLFCYERERTIVPERPFKFTYLRNLRLELIILGKEIRTTDVLDYAHLLKIAPFMETMELIMFMSCRHRPYCKADGELRIGLPHQHTHLQNVRIRGFFGHKEQVELALHILRSSIVLKKMDITPKLEITRIASRDSKYQQHYEDGHRVATEFVCKADHHNVVNVVGVLAQTAMEA
ncbi:hypothetical protein HU200_055564 [Digitaria exilis]|uniref:F-box domain-containing protein n=1 Tax=Digitaria exilis TaxID=1010633 RepID=A0A835AIC8_9POAL|nr:hypothetical protein HU200_055564 [Digitaria exilis]